MKESFITQAIFIVYTIIFAYFQAPCVNAMREYVPMNNPYQDPFHRRGTMVSAYVITVLSFLLLLFDQQVKDLIMPFVLIAWYWPLFNISLNHFTGKDWDYIGESAKRDRWLHKIFPHGDPGEAVVLGCAAAIILLNLLLYFL